MNALRTLALASLLLFLCLGARARADVIHLESGGQYRGEIVSETSRSVTIKTRGGGTIRVPRDEISRIVKEEDFAQTFKKRRARLKDSRSPKAWCELGAWAESKKLKKQARGCYERALKLDPECKPAREALGHKLHQGRWLTLDEYNRDVLGLVLYKGEWVTPADKANLEAGLVKRDGRWVMPKDDKEPAPKPKPRQPKRPKTPKKSDEKKDEPRRGKGAKFRAMSFNVRYDFKNDGSNRWDNRAEAVAKTIKQAQVVMIQEDKAHQVEDLKRLLPSYQIVGGGRNPTGSGERCSVLVRRKDGKIKDWGEFWLSDTPEVKGSNTWRDRYPRKVTWALIDMKGARSPLLVLNTHLPEKDKGRDPENRVKGARVMNEFLRKRVPAKERKKVAILIAGDYNSAPDEEPRKTLVGSGKTATGLRDSWNEAPHPSFAGTFNGFKGLHTSHRIDWLLVGGPIRVRRYHTFDEKVDGRWPSDHYPIWIDVELR